MAEARERLKEAIQDKLWELELQHYNSIASNVLFTDWLLTDGLSLVLKAGVGDNVWGILLTLHPEARLVNL